MKGRGGAGQNPDVNTRPLHSGAGGTDISSEVGSLLAEESTGWCIRPREGLKEEETGSSRRGRGGYPQDNGDIPQGRADGLQERDGGPRNDASGESKLSGVLRHIERATAWWWGCVSTQNNARRDNGKAT